MRQLVKAACLVSVLISANTAFARPTLVKVGGQAKEVSVDNKEASFRVNLKGTQTSLLTVDLYGGKVDEVEAQARDLTKGKSAKRWRFSLAEQSAARALVQGRGCLSVAVELPEEDKWPTFEELGLTADLFEQFRLLFQAIYEQVGSQVVGSQNLRCSLVAEEVKTWFLELMNLALAGRYQWTDKDTCLFLDSEYLDDAYRYFGITPSLQTPRTSQGRSSSWVGVMRKDACMGEKRGSTYEVVVTAKVRGTKKVWVKVTESAPVGKRAASIKPVSVGKLAPAPLLLMQSLSLCNQSLQKVTWKRGAPLVTPLSIEDVISYRGLALNRANVSSALTGGYGVFDLEDGRSAYGVCLSMTRTRQRVNGYPLPVAGGS